MLKEIELAENYSVYLYIFGLGIIFGTNTEIRFVLLDNLANERGIFVLRYKYLNPLKLV